VGDVGDVDDVDFGWTEVDSVARLIMRVLPESTKYPIIYTRKRQL